MKETIKGRTKDPINMPQSLDYSSSFGQEDDSLQEIEFETKPNQSNKYRPTIFSTLVSSGSCLLRNHTALLLIVVDMQSGSITISFCLCLSLAIFTNKIEFT